MSLTEQAVQRCFWLDRLYKDISDWTGCTKMFLTGQAVERCLWLSRLYKDVSDWTDRTKMSLTGHAVERHLWLDRLYKDVWLDRLYKDVWLDRLYKDGCTNISLTGKGLQRCIYRCICCDHKIHHVMDITSHCLSTMSMLQWTEEIYDTRSSNYTKVNWLITLLLRVLWGAVQPWTSSSGSQLPMSFLVSAVSQWTGHIHNTRSLIQGTMSSNCHKVRWLIILMVSFSPPLGHCYQTNVFLLSMYGKVDRADVSPKVI